MRPVALPLVMTMILPTMFTILPRPALAADAALGAVAFRKCASCHQVGPAARAGFGPHLNGIFGRRAGSTPYNYSPAMKKSGIVWTDKTLAAFLRAPSDVVPDTKMRFWGIGDERQIANILAYLRQFQASAEQSASQTVNITARQPP